MYICLNMKIYVKNVFKKIILILFFFIQHYALKRDTIVILVITIFLKLLFYFLPNYYINEICDSMDINKDIIIIMMIFDEINIFITLLYN